MTKKISKVIIYYEDGTYEEVKAGVSGLQSEKDKKDVGTNPVIPDFRPDTQKVKEFNPSTPHQPTWVPHYTQPARDPWPYPWRQNEVWCSSTPDHWSSTSTGNSQNLNKYTITSTGNGNVDLSK